MPDKSIRVLLVDDHAVVRQGLRMMLSHADHIAVAAEASDAREAMALLQTQRFDVVITDVNLPDRNGLDLLRLIKHQAPQMPVLILSMYPEETYAVRALQLGAAGYLTKSVEASDLAVAITKAAHGGKYITPLLAERLATALEAPSHLAPHERLSTREFEVLRHIVSGTSLVHAATEMHVSAKTITAYRSRIMEKMSCTTNAELMRYALERGLFS